MKTMKQENKMKKEKKERPAINIEMIDKNNNHNDMTKKTAKKNNTNTDNNNNTTTKKKTIKKKHQLSCYNVFGLRGFLIYILMIAITVFHFIVGLAYSKSPNRLFGRINISNTSKSSTSWNCFRFIFWKTNWCFWFILYFSKIKISRHA